MSGENTTDQGQIPSVGTGRGLGASAPTGSEIEMLRHMVNQLSAVLIAAGAPEFRNAEHAAAWAEQNRQNAQLLADLESGERIILPKTKAHAQGMYRVAYHWLSQQPDPSPNPELTGAKRPV